MFLVIRASALVMHFTPGCACRRDIEHALPVLMRHRKPLMLHAEILSDTNGTCDAGCSPRSHATWLAMRPPKFEIDAARDIVAALHAVRRKHEELWANATQPDSAFGVHIAHLSSVEALPVFQQVCSWPSAFYIALTALLLLTAPSSW